MIDRVKGKEILVVGMARSGLAAAKLLAGSGAAKITVIDSKEPDQLTEAIASLEKIAQVEVITGTNSPEMVYPGLSMIIKSPGVSPSLELFQKADQLSVPVISEIELAYHFLRTPIIGVTGTNGKTTTTSLIAAILRKSRFDPVVAAGNIGNPLSGLAGKISAQGMIVAELSSFQLENIIDFRATIAVFLNFAADHLDYHQTLDRYLQAKSRIFANQAISDYAVLNLEDHYAVSMEKICRSTVTWFGRRPVPNGLGIKDNLIYLFRDEIPTFKVCSIDEIVLPGEHNLENCLAAGTAAWVAGADLQSIAAVLKSFQAIEHRLEQVRIIDGVEYINDSKGTNPGATMKALKSYPGRGIILIAGGKDKHADFLELAKRIKDQVRFVVLLGETKVKLAEALTAIGFTAFSSTDTLREAVLSAAVEAESGEIVLLSPACASWDMFSSYEERGNRFKEVVSQLPGRGKISGVMKHDC